MIPRTKPDTTSHFGSSFINAAGTDKPAISKPIVTDFHSQQRFGESRFDLKPRVGRTFRSLPRRVFTALDCRSDKANRLERIRVHLWNGFHRLADVMHLSASESAFS